MFIHFFVVEVYIAAKPQAIGSATFLPMSIVTDITSAIPAEACNIAKLYYSLISSVIG
jgi:hypothetical protein